jgi:SagB-type dehydrogenase family enzyme
MLTGKAYHYETSYYRLEMKGHSLDWSNQPSVYKDYGNLEKVDLPGEVSWPEGNLSDVIMGMRAPKIAPFHVGIADVARVLALSYSLTAKSRHPDGDFYYRSAPSAGALYPCELYLMARSISGLEDGLYHYSIGRNALVKLRSGIFPSYARFRDSDTGNSPLLTFFLTTVFFRSAWKYRERSYRYDLLDSGHLLEGLALALRAASIPFDATCDFDDEHVNLLLGVDPQREVCLAVVGAFQSAEAVIMTGEAIRKLPIVAQDSIRTASWEVDYPIVRQIHSVSSFVSTSREAIPDMIRMLGTTEPSSWMEIDAAGESPEIMNYAEAVVKRRSRRNFIPGGLPRNAWKTLLSLICEPCGRNPADAHDPPYDKSLATGFLTAGMEGLERGFYLLDRSQRSLGLVKTGSMNLVSQMAHICLDQDWLGNAAFHFVFLTNFDALDHAWGPRGYRYAMMTAGRLGHRIYVSATALGLGCCGVGAYYDGEAATLLGLNDSSRMLYLVAVGPIKRAP